MLWLLLVPLLVAAALFGRSRTPPPPAPWRDDPTDPLDQLIQYGTVDDARRLIEQGHGNDLAGLGWRDGD